MTKKLGLSVLAVALMAMPACGKKVEEKKESEATSGAKVATGTADKPAIKSSRGVDLDKKIIYIGTLNDESGVGAPIGKSYANGKRLLANVVNAGGSGYLPEGWKIELVERDHGYNSQKAVQEYDAIKDKVLFLGTSFGTPNTIPLRDSLERDSMVAFPASLSSEMASHPFTPPPGPSYKVEAMRALDWAIEDAGGKDKVKAAVVYQGDDYGTDGLEGMKAAAAHHGIELVAEVAVAPGTKDSSPVIKQLKDAKANYVLLTVLPGSTGSIVGAAAKMKFAPKWIGNTPAWIDPFFSGALLPTAAFGSFHWVTGLPYWGEDLPGMDKFVAAWDTHGKDFGNPDFYVMASYLAGLLQLEAFSRALENGDVTPEGYKNALATIKDYNAGGLMQPIDLSTTPYVTSTRTRILKPDFEKKTWALVADYADPQTPLATAAAGGEEKAPAGEEKAPAGDEKPADEAQ